MIDEKEIALRIARLREQRGVSARDMSLTLGQNPGYINNIETGKTRPSITGVLYICDYFRITPSEFFDFSSASPAVLREITELLKRMDHAQLTHLYDFLKSMITT